MRCHYQPEEFQVLLSPYNGSGWCTGIYIMRAQISDKLKNWLNENTAWWDQSSFLPSTWDDDPELDYVTFKFKSKIDSDSFISYMKKEYCVK